ncbi:hypothetical protein QR680_005675 [Steinernema hermaphroditum]|uniref:Uncharacterized protein n=1 Tax=Steinernema hermaphroditum TaxID=289476 RepID=A0AA39LW48_9BILA|nr:hypothetical protein QR680_005675 [Steinernema hermaphroditum]
MPPPPKWRRSRTPPFRLPPRVCSAATRLLCDLVVTPASWLPCPSTSASWRPELGGVHGLPSESLEMPFTCTDICKLILAFILPPVGVFLEKGCDLQLLINVLLTLLGYIPGIIHAIWVIFYY